MEVERNKGVDDKENSGELPADEVSAKMEVDPAGLLSEEEQSMKKMQLGVEKHCVHLHVGYELCNTFIVMICVIFLLVHFKT